MSAYSHQTACVTVSIVSHLQADIAQKLLGDLASCPLVSKVVFVQNLPEPLVTLPQAFTGRKFELISNESPKGFAENHNMAFARCDTPYFCVMNPDIRLKGDPFPFLLSEMSDSKTALCAPRIENPAGSIEDSARRFPTPLNLLAKLMGKGDGRYEHSRQDKPFTPDWIGGMLMLLKASAFNEIGGFDEGYFLYYEDVDLCVRLRKSGWNLCLVPNAVAIHDARRSSHRNLRYLSWHLKSMFRYFWKHLGRLPKARFD